MKLFLETLKFFGIEENEKVQKLKFNLKIWNTPKLVTISGYTLSILIEPLQKMAKYIKNNQTIENF